VIGTRVRSDGTLPPTKVGVVEMTDARKDWIDDPAARDAILKFVRGSAAEPNLDWDGLVEALDDPDEYDYGRELPAPLRALWPRMDSGERMVAMIICERDADFRRSCQQG
jgi:hypothetical protein